MLVPAVGTAQSGPRARCACPQIPHLVLHVEAIICNDEIACVGIVALRFPFTSEMVTLDWLSGVGLWNKVLARSRAL